MKLVKNTRIILMAFRFLLFFVRGSSRFTAQTSSFSRNACHSFDQDNYTTFTSFMLGFTPDALNAMRKPGGYLDPAVVDESKIGSVDEYIADQIAKMQKKAAQKEAATEGRSALTAPKTTAKVSSKSKDDEDIEVDSF